MKKLWLTFIVIIVLLSCAYYFASFYREHNYVIPAKPVPRGAGIQPNRIVSLAPDLTEILFALGLGERITAVSSDSDYPPETAEKQKTGTFWQPNIEAIIASKPNLVVTLSFEQQKAAADTLHKLGYPVLTLRLETIEQLLAAIQEVGTAADCRQQAAELVKDITGRIADLKSKFASADKVRVLWVVQVEPLRVAAPNTFINELLELAGGKNVVGPAIGQYPSIGGEEILACGAEVIIQSSMGASDIAKQQQAADIYWSRWPNLPAVKNNRIYVVESDTILRLGPRLPQGIEMIGRCLHPDMFPQQDR